MDYKKTGALIKALRQEQQLTQKQLAGLLCLSDKTISKWERGCGLPDISVLAELSRILQVDAEKLLSGDLSLNDSTGGSMKNIGYYVCQNCNSITLSTGGATVSCCGRKLDALLPKKAEEHQKLTAELIENDWYLSSNHPMEKNDYISFVAFSTGDTVQLVKQYPEWDLSLRIPKKGHGKLVWYSKKEGLLFQIL